MTKEVKVVVSAEASRFQRGMSDAEAATSKLHNALDRFGPVGKGVANILDKLGFSSVGMAVGVGGAAVAVGAAAKIAEDAISQYTTLGDAVRRYSQLTGQSAEASTRQVFAFKELGLDTDTVAAGMFRLGREAATGAPKLAALGVQVAKTKDGSVDLNQTLLNLIEAYQRTGDAAKRSEIIFAAFGKAGASMMPLLETNIAELARLEKQVQLLYTQKDLDAIRRYEIAQRELKQSNDDLGLSIGRVLLPAQTTLVEGMNENIYVQQHLDEEMVKLYGHIVNTRVAWIDADRALRAQYRTALDARQSIDALAQSQQEAANAAKQEAAAEDQLYDSIHKNVDASFAYEQSLIDLQKAHSVVAGESLDDAAKAQKIADAQATLSEQIRLHGRSSRQAADAEIALRKAQEDAGASGLQAAEDNLRLREAYVKVADAAVALAEDQAAVAGTTLSAEEKAQVFRDKLTELMNQLAPGNPLRKNLQGYIDQLNRIPAAVSTSVRLYGVAAASRVASGHGAIASYDEGGTVPGPTGSPQLAVVHGGETVTPPGKGGINVMIHIGTYVGNADQLSKMLAHELRISGAFR